MFGHRVHLGICGLPHSGDTDAYFPAVVCAILPHAHHLGSGQPGMYSNKTHTKAEMGPKFQFWVLNRTRVLVYPGYPMHVLITL